MSNSLSTGKSAAPMVAMVLILFAVIGSFLYVKPTWDSVTQLAAAREEKTITRNSLNTKLVDLQQLQQELQLTSEVVRETTLSAVPEKLDQDELILDVSKIAKKNDMLMNGINFGIPTSSHPGEVAKVTVSTNITGNQSSLISYLRDVEANTRKLTVKSISVQIGETDSGISRVNFSINMEAYFQGII